MVRVAERSGISSEEYLAWEREQEGRHEFIDGEVFAMSGGSPRHNALGARTIAALSAGVVPHGCTVLSSDQRLGIADGERYVYPEVTVVCGKFMLQAGTNDVLANPTIVVEVLSASTEKYDRGQKWEAYQRIASVTDYVLVSQDRPRIEHYRRDDSGGWVYRAAAVGGRVRLTDGTTLEVDALFAGIFDLPGD